MLWTMYPKTFSHTHAYLSPFATFKEMGVIDNCHCALTMPSTYSLFPHSAFYLFTGKYAQTKPQTSRSRQAAHHRCLDGVAEDLDGADSVCSNHSSLSTQRERPGASARSVLMLSLVIRFLFCKTSVHWIFAYLLCSVLSAHHTDITQTSHRHHTEIVVAVISIDWCLNCLEEWSVTL